MTPGSGKRAPRSGLAFAVGTVVTAGYTALTAQSGDPRSRELFEWEEVVMEEDFAWRDEGSGESSAVSRRRFLGMSAAAGLVAMGIGSGATQVTPQGRAGPQLASGRLGADLRPAGVLGANFNGDPSVMSYPELNDVEAKWVRGFFAMPDADQGNPADQPAIRALLTAAGRGYGTVLSLKFPYFHQPIPTAGTPAMADAERRLDAVLPVVMNKVDVLVIGNEPFIECEDAERDSAQLNAFYEAMAQRAIDERGKHFASGSKTQLYMGALNHLDLPGWRTAATQRWMGFVRGNPAIAGTDIHPHLPDPGAGSHYLDYILPRMRPDQKFLATEFSLVLFYKKHLTDAVPAAFANRYHLPPGTPVWRVLKDALRQPFPQQKWDDLLSMSPWFADNKNFMRDQVDSFRATGRLAVATYGLGQDAAMSSDTFSPGSTPWLLNSMFCQHTVQPAPNGLPGRNTVWTDEFRSLQHN
jgi:hypothetical protein